MNKFRNRSLLTGLVILSVIFLIPMVANARSAKAEEAQQGVEDRKTVIRQTVSQKRLTNAKLKVCQNRQKSINNIIARISDRGQKQLDLFTNIAERTENFYNEKGRILANYEELVSEVNSKRDIAQAVVDTIKMKAGEFDCNGDNPRGTIDDFKSSLNTEIEALKDYKTAVKNLIVGVKSVQGVTSSNTNNAEGGEQ